MSEVKGEGWDLKERYLLENKALQAIEALCMMLGDGVHILTATCDELKKFASQVYRISHAVQCGVCRDAHDDWRKDIDEILTTADKRGIAKYENPLEEETG